MIITNLQWSICCKNGKVIRGEVKGVKGVKYFINLCNLNSTPPPQPLLEETIKSVKTLSALPNFEYETIYVVIDRVTEELRFNKSLSGYIESF